MRDVVEAKAFCESIIPEIETYKEKNGSFPEDISWVARKRIKNLRVDVSYRREQDDFIFTIDDSSQLFAWFTYRYNDGRWIYTVD